MTFSTTYKSLFQVNILHQYFLNKGTLEYSNMPDAEKEKQLICYDVSNLFNVLPSAKSQQMLLGHKLIFKRSSSGFTVWCKVSDSNKSLPFITLSDNLELTFLLKLKNHTFFNFSNLKFENANKLFFFSNQRLDSESGSFPLLKKEGSNNLVNDNYVLGETSSLNELEKLTPEERQNLFGLIKIHLKGNSALLNITNNQGKIRTPNPVFEILFENRKTIWRYIFNENQEVESYDDVTQEGSNANQLITREEQPLTAFGFVSIEHGGVELPNPDANLVKPDSTNNKIYSEIYIYH